MTKLIQSFRLISGQILVGQMDTTITEAMKAGVPFRVDEPIELLYEPSYDEMGDRDGVGAYFGDFLAEYNDSWVEINPIHVMVYKDNLSVFIKNQYEEFLPYLKQNREEKIEDEADFLERKTDSTPHTPLNHELYEEILANIDNEEGNLKTIH